MSLGKAANGRLKVTAQMDFDFRGLNAQCVRTAHWVYVSQPQAVAAIITKAAHGVALVTQ
jgi:hypothetical protein